MRNLLVRLAIPLVAAGALATSLAFTAPAVDAQQSYVPISGEGSTWSQNFIDETKRNVAQLYGITVNYAGTGSSSGRRNWLNGTVDFAASDIPFQFKPEDGSPPENPPRGGYAYIPITAGGTAFVYNLKINGQRVTNLRLSGENVAKIFTGAITKWDDPALRADNPGLNLPSRNVVPVVRSDGSGSTAQFTRWLVHQHKGIWDDYCRQSGRAPACGSTSFYPTIQGMIAQSGDPNVAGYVAQSFAEGAIGYVNYSYALGVQFPVAKVLNAAGYYTEPTPQNVAVSLLKARINTDEGSDDYLTQILDDVYTDPDRRSYPLSSYSYLILPTKVSGNFSESKGRTLAAFTQYAMCQGQQQSASLGYSPMPINLVEASFHQIRRIPGADVGAVNIRDCRNPTFDPDGSNRLAAEAPFPQECDKRGQNQCATGTGGVKGVITPVKPEASGGQQGGGTGGSGGSAGAGGGAGGTTDGAGGTTGGSTDGLAGDDGAGGAARDCDPDTGLCDGDLAFAPLDRSGGGSANAQPTVLSAPKGWSASQTLMVVITLLVLALILLPALLWRRLDDGGQRS